MIPRMSPVIVSKKKKSSFGKGEWIFELKYDGNRSVLYYEDHKCYMISKWNRILSGFSELEKELARKFGLLRIKSLVLDGEVVCYDQRGAPTLAALVGRLSKPEYIAYDILWLNGVDLREKFLEERKEILSKTLKNTVKISKTWSNGLRLFNSVLEMGFEGIVAKKLGEKYFKKAHWYAVKNPYYTDKTGLSFRKK